MRTRLDLLLLILHPIGVAVLLRWKRRSRRKLESIRHASRVVDQGIDARGKRPNGGEIRWIIVRQRQWLKELLSLYRSIPSGQALNLEELSPTFHLAITRTDVSQRWCDVRCLTGGQCRLDRAFEKRRFEDVL